MPGETLIWLFQSVFFPVILALLIIVFLYGIVNYFVLGPNDMGREEMGRNQLLLADAGFISIILLHLFFSGALSFTNSVPFFPTATSSDVTFPTSSEALQ